ncbi:MAG: hypothetical protein JOZ19_15190 [Rubrobacter sp.]|nr:hypothetical protein [Rubrobacter sp.]
MDELHDVLRTREGWELYMEAERQDLERRRNGHLRNLLGAPLPGESSEELERLASEDEARAEEGLVEMRNLEGAVYYQQIEELSPEDRPDRLAGEGALAAWLTERKRIRGSL